MQYKFGQSSDVCSNRVWLLATGINVNFLYKLLTWNRNVKFKKCNSQSKTKIWWKISISGFILHFFIDALGVMWHRPKGVFVFKTLIRLILQFFFFWNLNYIFRKDLYHLSKSNEINRWLDLFNKGIRYTVTNKIRIEYSWYFFEKEIVQKFPILNSLTIYDSSLSQPFSVIISQYWFPLLSEG